MNFYIILCFGVIFLETLKGQGKLQEVEFSKQLFGQKR